MRSLLVVISLALFGAAPTAAGPYEDASAAYEAGDHAKAAQLFRPLAELGDPRAQNNLGNMYVNGDGVPRDYREAVKWLRLATDQSDAQAETTLGALYAEGNGVPQSYSDAAKWYRLAADQGFAVAQANLAVAYFRGRGVPPDAAEAVKWFRLAAEQGYTPAQLALGAFYEDGQGAPKDLARALMWYSLAATRPSELGPSIIEEAGKARDQLAAKMTAEQVAEAQRLAREWMTRTGQNWEDALSAATATYFVCVSKTAADFALASAEPAETIAKGARASCNDEHDGIINALASGIPTGDLTHLGANKVLESADEQATNRAVAAVITARAKQTAQPTPPSPKTNPFADLGPPPTGWITLPAETGAPAAGVEAKGRSADEMLKHGDAAIEAKNYAEAMRWFNKAADLGDARAMLEISRLYAGGKGVAQNDAEAMRWRKKAADLGNPDAISLLGADYEGGWDGVAQDYAEAMRWFRKAADQGDASAMESIGMFYNSGHGMAQDYAEAMSWYRKAANQGDTIAMYSIGMLYEYGKGVPQNDAEARVWIKKAAGLGDYGANMWLADHP